MCGERFPSLKVTLLLFASLYIRDKSQWSKGIQTGKMSHPSDILTFLFTPRNRVLLEKLTGFAANQDIPCILWNQKVHYRTDKRPEGTCSAISLDTKEELCHSVALCFQLCIDTGGEHFEHLKHVEEQHNSGFLGGAYPLCFQ